MLNRRELIGLSVAACTLSGLPVSFAFSRASHRPDICIVDNTLKGSGEMADAFAQASQSVLFYREEPGGLWMHTIEPSLRRRARSIAGFTSAESLFCLQYLTRDYGLSLTAHIVGRGVLNGFNQTDAELLDLRDPKYNDKPSAVTWLLVPTRG